MEDSWTTPAWELLLPPARAPRRQRRHQLETALRDAIRTGRLAPGTRLPASRALAADLGVSRGLVTTVYDQLRAEGYLVGRTGAGTYAAAPRPASATPHPGSATPRPASATPHHGSAIPRPVSVAPAGVSGLAETADALTAHLIGRGGPVPRWDFRPGRPDPALFPRGAWATLYRQVLTGLPQTGLEYGDARGVPELRAALAELLARRRGVVVDPAGIVVCGGVAQALSLLGRALVAAGHRTVATEDPGPGEHVMLLRTAGLASRPVPVDARGPAMAALEDSGARVMVVTPAHQFPTGVAYPAAARAALVAWASTVDGLVVEDDYDGDFRYDREPVGALQGLAPDRVAYAGSVSKSLAPGLRIGWLVPPASLLPAVVDLKLADDLCGPVIEQRVLAAFITSGRYDAHLRRCQRTYRSRRDALAAAVARYLPDAELTGIAAGLHAVLRLPAGDEAALAETARAAGVGVRPLRDYGTGPAPSFVLGYAHLSVDTITAGIAALAAAWS